MSREELQAYLDSQLAEIRRYHDEQVKRLARPIDFEAALEEWVERHSAAYQEFWFSRLNDKNLVWEATREVA